MPAPKKKTTIEIRDFRGTSISLTLFLSELGVADTVRELAQVWGTQWGGDATEVLIDGKLWLDRRLV